MHQPIVLRLVAIFAVLAAALNALDLNRAIALVGTSPPLQVVGATAIALLVTGVSLWLSMTIFRERLRSRLPVSLYLWFMLLIYPLSNVLRIFGLNLPRPEIPPDQLAAAAFFELARFVVIIVLLVWVGFSKTVKAYLAAQKSQLPPDTSLERTGGS